MTTAPECLKAARSLLLAHLDMHPGRTVDADLDPAEVGIVGDPAHVGGYHCGSDRVRRVDGVIRDYSVTESSRDRNGLTLHACALDVGSFSVSVGGKRHTLRSFSMWLVAQCKAGTADTRDIREVIYSPDGKVVKRWDRLGKRTSGDSSHLWHTHISYHRDAIKAGRDQTAVIRRYLTEIGLLAREDDDMEQSEKLERTTSYEDRTVGHVLADLSNLRDWLFDPATGTGKAVNPPPSGSIGHALLAAARQVPALAAKIDSMQRVEIDYDRLADAIVRRILTPQG